MRSLYTVLLLAIVFIANCAISNGYNATNSLNDTEVTPTSTRRRLTATFTNSSTNANETEANESTVTNSLNNTNFSVSITNFTALNESVSRSTSSYNMSRKPSVSVSNLTLEIKPRNLTVSDSLTAMNVSSEDNETLSLHLSASLSNSTTNGVVDASDVASVSISNSTTFQNKTETGSVTSLLATRSLSNTSTAMNLMNVTATAEVEVKQNSTMSNSLTVLPSASLTNSSTFENITDSKEVSVSNTNSSTCQNKTETGSVTQRRAVTSSLSNTSTVMNATNVTTVTTEVEVKQNSTMSNSLTAMNESSADNETVSLLPTTSMSNSTTNDEVTESVALSTSISNSTTFQNKTETGSVTSLLATRSLSNTSTAMSLTNVTATAEVEVKQNLTMSNSLTAMNESSADNETVSLLPTTSLTNSSTFENITDSKEVSVSNTNSSTYQNRTISASMTSFVNVSNKTESSNTSTVNRISATLSNTRSTFNLSAEVSLTLAAEVADSSTTSQSLTEYINATASESVDGTSSLTNSTTNDEVTVSDGVSASLSNSTTFQNKTETGSVTSVLATRSLSNTSTAMNITRKLTPSATMKVEAATVAKNVSSTIPRATPSLTNTTTNYEVTESVALSTSISNSTTFQNKTETGSVTNILATRSLSNTSTAMNLTNVTATAEVEVKQNSTMSNSLTVLPSSSLTNSSTFENITDSKEVSVSNTNSSTYQNRTISASVTHVDEPTATPSVNGTRSTSLLPSTSLSATIIPPTQAATATITMYTLTVGEEPLWTRTNDVTSSETESLMPPTPPRTASRSFMVTLTRSASRTVLLSDTSTVLPTHSASPSNTEVGSPSNSKVLTRTIPASMSPSAIYTITRSFSSSPNPTHTVSPAVTLSPVMSESRTISSTLPISKSETISDTPMPTVTRTIDETETRTFKPKPTITKSVTPRIPPTGSQSYSIPDTSSATMIDTPTASFTYSSSLSVSASLSDSASQLPTSTVSLSSTLQASSTRTPLQTATESGNLSTTLTMSASGSQTLTGKSPTRPKTGTEPLTKTESISQSETTSDSISSSDTLTESLSISEGSASSTYSKPPTRSLTITPPATVTGSGSKSLQASGSVSVSISAPTDQQTATVTNTRSISGSVSRSRTGTLTTTLSLSKGTASISSSPTLSRSATLTNSGTTSITMTLSLSDTVTCSATSSRTRGTLTMTLSLPPTTTVIPPTTTLLATPTVTLPTACPDNCVNGVCTRDPRWEFVYFCVCYQTQTRGYWTGSEHGGPCDKCMTGYYGIDCGLVCPGGSCAICSGHGVCRDGVQGDGTCDCHADPATGYWNGNACLSCAENFYGNDCKGVCGCSKHGVCNMGRTGDGQCTCELGWTGLACENCDATNPDCSSACPASPQGLVCYGNGVCGVTGTCICAAFFGTEACSVECPNHCSGHGTCLDGSSRNATCVCSETYAPPDCSTCRRGFYGPTCSNECPGGFDRPCNNSGTCDVNGVCTCDGTYGGYACDVPCPMRDGKVCGGHGTCVSSGNSVSCQCYASEALGHWKGALCDQCEATHGGPLCTIACPYFNGLLCSGTSRGYCNATNGKCACKPISSSDYYCGVYCESTLLQKCSNCETDQQYGENCQFNCTCVHGTCDSGKTGTGACECQRGYYGANCDKECLGGAANPCSGHGTCDALLGTCTCDRGYAHALCDVGCLGALNCSGNGVCDDGANGTGTCTCKANYVWNHTGCDSACDCNGHGECEYPSLVCKCQDRYVGLHCEQCTTGYWNASTCASPCIHGNTTGYDCQCQPGWGGMSCDVQCPSNSAGYCNARGTCGRLSGICDCDVGWVGSLCSCNTTTCKESNIYTECDAVTAQCVCLSSRTGPTCSKCRTGYYGESCLNPCPCNNHGACSIDNGICECFADEVNGYWTGGTCSLCLDGYLGANCNQKSNAISVMSTLKVSSTRDVSQLYVNLDTREGMLYVGGNALNAVFNVSTVLPNVLSTGTINTDTNNSQICGDIVGAAPIAFEGVTRMMYILQQNVTCLPAQVRSYIGSTGSFTNLTLQSPNVFFEGTSRPTDSFDRYLSYFLYDESTTTICAIPQFVTDCELFTKNLKTNSIGYLAPTIRSLRSAILSTKRPGSMWVSGIDKLTPAGQAQRCVISQIYTDGSVPFIQPVPFYPDFPLNGSCQNVDCLAEAGDLIVFATVYDAMYISAYDIARNIWYPPINVGVTSARCNAISYDPESEIGIAVFRNKVVKFTFQDNPKATLAYGQVYITSVYISRLVLHSAIQTLYAPLSTSKGLEVLRFMLLEVVSITPALAERIGGTVVTVTGRGFRNTTQLLCKIGEYTVPATYRTKNILTCVAPVVLSTKSCVTDAVEVSTTGIVFTQNSIGLDRPDSPTLEAVSPGFVRVAAPVNITLSGRGLSASSFAKCRFTDSGDAFYSPAYYENGDFICMSPNASAPWSPTSVVQLSLDGQAYGASSLSFLIVGQASGLSVQPNILSTVSEPISTLTTPITVYVVDERGNSLESVDAIPRFVTIVTDSLNTTNATGTTVAGKAVLSDFRLLLPVSGTWTFYARIGNWSTPFIIIVRYGTLHRFSVQTQPLINGDIIIPGSPIPRQTEVIGLDAAGNTVGDTTGIVVNVTLVAINPQTGELDLGHEETKFLSLITFINSGMAVLPQMVITPRFGTEYTILFAMARRWDINVTSVRFFPYCEQQMFFVAGTRECRECPSGKATCNGSDVLIAYPNYWRASAASLEFYECPRKSVCLGGVGGCAVGYSGPLCSVCDEGYGKGYRGTCEACSHVAADLVIIFLLLIVVLSVLLFSTIIIIQNYSVQSSLIGRSITTGIILVFYLQTVSLLAQLDLQIEDNYSGALAIVGVIADFRFYVLQSTNCVVSRLGLTSLHMSVIYSIGFIIFTALVALGTGLIVHRWPEYLMSQESIAAREGRLEVHNAIAALATSGRRRRDKVAERGVIYIKEHTKKAITAAAAQVVVVFLIQVVAITSFQLFDCQTIETSEGTESYVRSDMTVSCTSGVYNTVIGYATFVAIIVSGVFPLTAILGIAAARRHFSNDSYRLWTCTITYGVKDMCFFYQGMIIVRRILCICAIVFANYPLDSYMMVWALTIFTALTAFIQPFEYPLHNRYETIASASTIVSGNICYLFRVVSDSTSQGILAALLIIILVATSAYLVYSLLFDIIQEFIRRAHIRKLEPHPETNEDIVSPKDVRRELGFDKSRAELDEEEEASRKAAERKNKLRSKEGPKFSNGIGFDPFGSRFIASKHDKQQEEYDMDIHTLEQLEQLGLPEDGAFELLAEVVDGEEGMASSFPPIGYYRSSLGDVEMTQLKSQYRVPSSPLAATAAPSIAIEPVTNNNDPPLDNSLNATFNRHNSIYSQASVSPNNTNFLYAGSTEFGKEEARHRGSISTASRMDSTSRGATSLNLHEFRGEGQPPAFMNPGEPLIEPPQLMSISSHQPPHGMQIHFDPLLRGSLSGGGGGGGGGSISGRTGSVMENSINNNDNSLSMGPPNRASRPPLVEQRMKDFFKLQQLRQQQMLGE